MTDYSARATREAAAILDEITPSATAVPTKRSTLIDLLAVAWLQGAIYGSHASLADAEIAYQKVRAEL